MSLRATSARWRPALRMAWRDLRSHRVRSLVVIVLVAFPIAVAITVSTIASTARYGSDNSLYTEYGAADLKLEVTPWPKVRASIQDQGGWVSWHRTRGLDRGDRRTPGAVDAGALLPPGATVMRTGAVSLPLATGGSLDATVMDLDSPIVDTLVPVEQGRAPRTADEVAVAAPVAEELGLLRSDGSLRPDALLPLVDADPLRVVAISDAGDSYYGSSAVVPPTSELLATTAGDDLRGDEDTVVVPGRSPADERPRAAAAVRRPRRRRRGRLLPRRGAASGRLGPGRTAADPRGSDRRRGRRAGHRSRTHRGAGARRRGLRGRCAAPGSHPRSAHRLRRHRRRRATHVARPRSLDRSGRRTPGRRRRRHRAARRT